MTIWLRLKFYSLSEWKLGYKTFVIRRGVKIGLCPHEDIDEIIMFV
jgi:hypothetical protein